MVRYKESLNEAFTASGIATDGKVYFTSEEGNVYVVKSGPLFQLLSKNALKDISMATLHNFGECAFLQDATCIDRSRISLF